MTTFAFFGTSRFSVIILEDLKTKFNMTPSLIVTTPDRPKGRKHILTPPETKIWAEANGIEVYQPPKLKAPEVREKLFTFDRFIVASYGKIIPQEILDLPKEGAINIHPSLLPLYRGASPIQFQIAEGEKNVGISIMFMDEEMDHGDILCQKPVTFEDPFLGTYEDVEEILAHESASLLFDTLIKLEKKEIVPQEQEHSKATYTKMLEKEDGEIKLSDGPESNYRKYLAYHSWPKVFFYALENGVKKRNIVTEAEFKDGKFEILKIIPEGKKEITYKKS